VVSEETVRIWASLQSPFIDPMEAEMAKDYADAQIENHNNNESPHNLPSYTKMQYDGFKVFDHLNNLRVHLGQYSAGKYGLLVTGGEIYSTTVRTGTPTASTY